MTLRNAPYNVLFVDNDPDILSGLSEGLSGQSFNVLTAGAGAEALKILNKKNISLVVADYAMPEMSGRDLLHICRDRWPETGRIMLAGGSDLNLALHATFNGWVYQYLEKPIEPARMAAIVEEALDHLTKGNGNEYSRLLIAPEAQSAIMQHLRVTSSPDRPTYAETASSIDWALELCQSNLLPPELDRLRPVVTTIKAIADTITLDARSETPDETLNRIQRFIGRIS